MNARRPLVRVSHAGAVATLTLARPTMHNALVPDRCCAPVRGARGDGATHAETRAVILAADGGRSRSARTCALARDAGARARDLFGRAGRTAEPVDPVAAEGRSGGRRRARVWSPAARSAWCSRATSSWRPTMRRSRRTTRARLHARWRLDCAAAALVGRGRAAACVLLNRTLPAAEAHAWGIVTQLAPREQVAAAARRSRAASPRRRRPRARRQAPARRRPRRGRARARGRAAAVRRGDRRRRRARRRAPLRTFTSYPTRFRHHAPEARTASRSVSERAMYVVDWLHKQRCITRTSRRSSTAPPARARSYRQVDERASRFAELLATRWGLAPGARVAVLAGSSADYLEMLYGCAKAGVVMVCLNWRLPATELAPIIDDAQPSAFVCGEEFLAVAAAALAGRATLPGLVVRGAQAGSEARPAPGTPAGRHRELSDWPDYESALRPRAGASSRCRAGRWTRPGTCSTPRAPPASPRA